MLRQRVEQAAAAKPASAEAGNSRFPSAQPTPIGRKIGHQAANAKRGVRAFGEAILAPFTHAGGILWLEITGLFFALFAVFFGQSAYRLRSAWSQGSEHGHLLLYAVLTAGFAWFSVSSFLRARRKSKRGPGWQK
jgi:hypothetical protein